MIFLPLILCVIAMLAALVLYVLLVAGAKETPKPEIYPGHD